MKNQTFALSNLKLPWATIIINTFSQLRLVPNGATVYVVGENPLNPSQDESFRFECKARNITLRTATISGVPIGYY